MARGWQAPWATALAAVAVLLPPPAAEADTDQGFVGGFHFWFADSTAPPPPNFDIAQADCKGSLGEHLIGGGFRVNGSVSLSRVDELGPWDDHDGDSEETDAFRIVATFSGGGLSGMDAQAVCAGRPRTRAILSPRRRLGPLRGKTFKAPCPAGTHVSAGGGSVVDLDGGSEGQHVNSSYPYDNGDRNSKPSDGWAIRVFNAEVTEARVTTDAICTTRPIRYVASTTTVPAGSPALAHAGCSDLTHVAISGGSRFGGPASEARLISMISEDDGDMGFVPGDQIEFSHQVDSGDPKELERIVICGVPST